ncbi:uncharacterized protein B0T23DRAFT_386592 [Neurospora hispaniola]|uniref:Secreted protein n=1 Tax=Neurospora hispaniola TaxID=588809 RepID=A0AAJ0I1T9_9PEZI|nr:hypothetical protein B0T23DRAFT_386592 [Neurospora hispaniola]
MKQYSHHARVICITLVLITEMWSHQALSRSIRMAMATQGLLSLVPSLPLSKNTVSETPVRLRSRLTTAVYIEAIFCNVLCSDDWSCLHQIAPVLLSLSFSPLYFSFFLPH